MEINTDRSNEYTRQQPVHLSNLNTCLLFTLAVFISIPYNAHLMLSCVQNGFRMCSTILNDTQRKRVALAFERYDEHTLISLVLSLIQSSMFKMYIHACLQEVTTNNFVLRQTVNDLFSIDSPIYDS